MTMARFMTAWLSATVCRSSRSARPTASSLATTSRRPAITASGRKATKWRCPSGECKPASVWVKASRLHPLIPRETPRFTALYRRRSAVEREFGRLKHQWALAPLRVRGLDRVRLHADLTILAKLACTLARARPAPVAA
jgi:transposase